MISDKQGALPNDLDSLPKKPLFCVNPGLKQWVNTRDVKWGYFFIYLHVFLSYTEHRLWGSKLKRFVSIDTLKQNEQTKAWDF